MSEVQRSERLAVSRAERGEQPEANGGTDAAAAVRIEVVGGGTPGDAELAALVVALAPTALPPVADPVPAWAQASLLENVGGRRPAVPSDLRLPAHLG